MRILYQGTLWLSRIILQLRHLTLNEVEKLNLESCCSFSLSYLLLTLPTVSDVLLENNGYYAGLIHMSNTSASIGAYFPSKLKLTGQLC